ncbi:metallophosphoesterase [Deinococcus radiomollis]|uniref:metallophosphoesterase n=1 Tax=Deinococcus radiomollis TaxID=468916 RepID=UPI003891ACE4
MKYLELPALCLVVLIGVSDQARSDFARRHFAPEEVQTTLGGAATRLQNGLLAVLNAPHLQAADREAAPQLAREHDVRAVGIVLDLDAPDPSEHHRAALLRSGLGGPDSPGLHAEGFRTVYRLRTEAELEGTELRRMPLPPDHRELHGPFDLIGDVHGCLPELLSLLEQLGYALNGEVVTPPPGRTLVFLGDLTDRGPDSPGVLRLVMDMVVAGTALCVQGNHDAKLLRALQGHAVQLTHGLEVTLDQFTRQPPDVQPPGFAETVKAFLAGLPSHLLLDGGNLVAAHAGLPAHLQGRDSRRVWAFALYGDVDRSGPPSGDGLPNRRDWAAGYHGPALVAYGHTPVQFPRWKHRTVNLDTGCVFGGQLSALRYPELKTVSVPARAVYREAGRAPVGVPVEERQPDL